MSPKPISREIAHHVTARRDHAARASSTRSGDYNHCSVRCYSVSPRRSNVIRTRGGTSTQSAYRVERAAAAVSMTKPDLKPAAINTSCDYTTARTARLCGLLQKCRTAILINVAAAIKNTGRCFFAGTQNDRLILPD